MRGIISRLRLFSAKQFEECLIMRKFGLFVLAIGMVTLATAQEKEKAVPRSAGELKAIESLRKMGALVLEVAQNDNHLDISYLQPDDKFGDAHLAPLKELKGIVHLNLRNQPVTDALLVHIKSVDSLIQLHLEKTKITDKGLAELKGLKNLEYLNIYGTEVTDAGVAQLAELKKLKKVFLWQTKATKAGAANLAKAIPGVDVNMGYDDIKLPEPKKDEPKKDMKKEEKKKDVKKDDKKTDTKKDDKKADAAKDAKKEEKK
jgi:hypothetical protein